MRHGWTGRPVEMERRTTLVFDPTESHNVVADRHLAPVVPDLRARLDHWMRQTDDPLLEGPVSPPPGAECNDQDQISAGEPSRRAPGAVRGAASPPS